MKTQKFNTGGNDIMINETFVNQIEGYIWNYKGTEYHIIKDFYMFSSKYEVCKMNNSGRGFLSFESTGLGADILKDIERFAYYQL
jgi:hypothetical protein